LSCFFLFFLFLALQLNFGYSFLKHSFLYIAFSSVNNFYLHYFCLPSFLYFFISVKQAETLIEGHTYRKVHMLFT